MFEPLWSPQYMTCDQNPSRSIWPKVLGMVWAIFKRKNQDFCWTLYGCPLCTVLYWIPQGGIFHSFGPPRTPYGQGCWQGELYCTVQYCTVPIFTLQYCTVLYCQHVTGWDNWLIQWNIHPCMKCTVQVICTVLYCIPQGGILHSIGPQRTPYGQGCW